jgi:ATP-dependent DNA helicase RecQ
VLDLLPHGVPVLGTTATANDRVVADVQAQLGEELLTIRGPLDRESLALDAIELRSQPDRLAWLAQVLPALPGTGIVYTLTVADAARVADWLTSQGITARAYTGETDIGSKLEIESDLQANRLKAVVATSALGMGYDKPDLAFVVHFQSPGSPIAYYQQVGRAGRGIGRAEGILLTGHEDRDIQDYFIRTAFPPQEQAEAVVALLSESGDWVPLHQIEQHVNVRRSRLESMLKNLEVDGAVEREGRKYRRTLAPWSYDEARVEQVTAQRQLEQATMHDYARTSSCLMEILRGALDDPTAAPCGRCSRCTGESHTVELQRDLVIAAQEFLRGQTLVMQTRKQLPDMKRIAKDEQLTDGWALARLGDGGWGGQIGREREAGAFSDELVDALAKLLSDQQPDPPFGWVAGVPSRRSPELVASLAARVASRLGLPYLDVLAKARDTPPQSEMENSAQQARNVGGAFDLTGAVPDTACLLIDDLWDSGWTMTVLAQLLRSEGSGPVYGAVLASSNGT